MINVYKHCNIVLIILILGNMFISIMLQIKFDRHIILYIIGV